MLKRITTFITLVLIPFSISSAQAPSGMIGKKLAIIGSITELDLSINIQLHFTSKVNQVGLYNEGLSNEDWSLERYHYRKTGEQTANLTIINYDGDQARLQLSFESPTSGSVSGSYYNVSNELQWSTLDATWTLGDLDLATIPDTELPSDPSGYYAPASIADGALSAQDKYWPIYDESISFSGTDNFSASITNDDPGSPLSASGTSYTYTKMGTNSATLSYSIDGAGISFEYALQFTGENTGIYSKFADYGGGSTDITTGPFSLSSVAAPTQYAWEDYDDFSNGTLDSNKWTATNSYVSGNDPTFANGRVELTGLTSQHPHNNTFLIVKDIEDIRGVESDIWLPTGAPSDTGVLIGIMDAGVSVGYLDLWGDGDNTRMYVYLENSNTGETIDFQRNAELGVIYKVGVINKNDKTALLLNGEKVAEVTTWQSENLNIVFRGVNDVESPFTAYLDNVRVIRDWEEYDDFSTGSLDSSKWDVSYYAGGKPPVINDGVLELSGTSQEDFNETYLDESFLEQFPNAISDLGDSDAHSNVVINENLDAIEFEVMMPSSVPEKVGMGLYILDFSTFEDSLDASARANATRAYADMWYESGNLEVNFGVIGHSTVYIPCSLDTYYRIGVVFEESKTSFYLNGEKKAEFEETFTKDYFLMRGTSSESVPFTAYMDNVRVLRRSQDTPAPVPFTVVSDPNGKPVVVQLGDEYQWNSTLDGVTLWALGVGEDGVSKKGTAKFENGNKLVVFDIVDEVNGNETYNHPYIVDENGYIRVTESVYQYYNVVGVDGEAIRIIQDSNGLESVADNGENQVTMLYFTTRAAAEEYYYSKVNPKDWMWFDHYPWVYSNEEQDWLYFYPSGGTLLYWSNKGQAWRQFH